MFMPMPSRPRFIDQSTQVQQDRFNGPRPNVPELFLAIAMFPDGLELVARSKSNKGVLVLHLSKRRRFPGAETLLVAPMMVSSFVNVFIVFTAGTIPVSFTILEHVCNQSTSKLTQTELFHFDSEYWF